MTTPSAETCRSLMDEGRTPLDTPRASTAAASPRAPLAALVWTLALGLFWMLLEFGRILASQTLVDLPTDLGRFVGYLPWQMVLFGAIGSFLAGLARWARAGTTLLSWLRLGAALLAFLGPSAALGVYRLSRDPLQGLATFVGVAVSIAFVVLVLALVGRALPRRARDGWPVACVIGFSFVVVPFMSRASAPLRLGSLHVADFPAMTQGSEWVAGGIATGIVLGLQLFASRLSTRSAAILAILLSLLGITLTAAGPARAQPSRERPDVIVILIDAMRADVVGGSGARESLTPNIDAIASESIVFERAYSAANRTARSMPAILTSLSAAVVGESLSDEATTLAEYLQEAGYETYGISTNPYVSEFYGYHQGFDGFHDPTVAPDYLVMSPLKILDQLLPAPGYHWGLISAQLYYATASEVRSRATRILRDAGRPLFLYLHLMDLHGPYLPPRAFLPPEYEPSDFVSYFDLMARLDKGTLEPALTRPTLANARQRYEGELRFADQEVGRFVEALRRDGRWDEALVWILSDHGEAFGEHDWVGHSGSNVFSTLLHVPMMLKPPRSSGLRPAIAEAPASTFDVVPTTLSLVGIEPSRPLFGINLVDFERHTARAPMRGVISDGFTPGGRLLSCIEGSWQLVAFVPMQAATGQPIGLFHLDRDPTTRRDLLAANPRIAERLMASIRARLTDERRLSMQGETKVADPEMLERLKSLGYISE